MPKPEQSWFVYMVQCADNTYYTGITTDLKRRVHEHNATAKGAKYTRNRRPVKLVYSKSTADRSTASKLEYQIKQMPAYKKRLLK